MMGKNVWSTYGEGCLRIGKIIEAEMRGRWCYVKVNWVDDHGFEMDRERLIQLRGVDSRSDWSRIDKVSFFKKEDLLNKINKL